MLGLVYVDGQVPKYVNPNYRLLIVLEIVYRLNERKSIIATIIIIRKAFMTNT